MARKSDKRRSSNHSHNLSSSRPPPSDKMTSKWSKNIKYPIVLAYFKLKKRTNVSILELKILRLKSTFGISYLTLVGDSAPIEDLHECLGTTLEEFHTLQEEIKENYEQIKEKEKRINEKLRGSNYPQSRESAGNSRDKLPKVRGKKRSETKQKNTRKVGGLTLSSLKVETVEYDDGSSDYYDTGSCTTEELAPNRRPKKKLQKRSAGQRKR